MGNSQNEETTQKGYKQTRPLILKLETSTVNDRLQQEDKDDMLAIPLFVGPPWDHKHPNPSHNPMDQHIVK